MTIKTKGNHSLLEKRSRLRVLLLASGDLWAGAEVMFYQLVSGLIATEEVDLLIVLMNRGRIANELARLDASVFIIDESKSSFVQSIALLRKAVKDFAPDIIHSHRYKENILAWCAAFGATRCRLVATQHGMPETVGIMTTKEWLRNNLFFRALSFGFKRTVVVSEEMRRSLMGRYGFTRKDVIVIHNGICIPERVISFPGARLVVGSAGRLFPVKDFSLFVDVARVVVQQGEHIDFVLAGDGPELNMLREKVKRHGMEERFTFLGQQENMASFYEGLGVYINTSKHEGIPMSVLEAMSYGLPIVAPKVGGFPEVLDQGVHGFLVEDRDPDTFAQYILRLSNFEERRRMGQAARERAIASFSQETMVQRYLQLYNKLSRR
jgi:glycosyltransferase involved in cell wall biosynthesis